MSEDNKAVFRHYIEIWARGEVDALNDVLGPGYIGHSGSNPDWDEDVEQVKKRIAGYHAAHPDIRVEIHDQVAEGDRVATRMTAREAKDGKENAVAGFNVSRFQDAKVVEEWALWERLP
jgi:predicted SnoaL-like aldol condensation-catalyzing enzyme